MNEGLDLEAIASVQAILRARIARRERQQMMAPLAEALRQQMRAVNTDIVPGLMAGPELDVRRSVLSMEKSLRDLDLKRSAAIAQIEDALESARRRTASLQKWLDSLP